jgi:hypothetical protein
LSADQESTRLRLKNASEVDARRAYVVWRMLEAVNSQRPHHIATLSALAHGEEPSAFGETAVELRNEYPNWFASSGHLTPLARDVLRSALRDTPEGVVVVNPFQLTTQHDRDLFDRVERQQDGFLRRLFRRRDEPPSGHSIP